MELSLDTIYKKGNIITFKEGIAWLGGRRQVILDEVCAGDDQYLISSDWIYRWVSRKQLEEQVDWDFMQRAWEIAEREGVLV